MQQSGDSRRGQTQVLMPVVGVIVGLAIGAAVVLMPESADTTTPASNETEATEATEATETANPDLAELRLRNERLELELRQARMRNELADLRSELDQVRSNQISSTTVDAAKDFIRRGPQNSSPVKSSGVGEKTLAYWKKMNDIILQEASMRSAPASGVNLSNAGDFVGKRVAAYSYAVSAFDKLDRSNVDARAIETATDVRNWYAKGLEISLQAQTLMNSDSQTRRGTVGLQWRAAEMKHNGDVAAVNQRAARVQKELSDKYGLQFPELE